MIMIKIGITNENIDPSTINVSLRIEHPLILSKTFFESIKPRNRRLLDTRIDSIQSSMIIPSVIDLDFMQLFFKGNCIAINRNIETAAK